MQGIQVIMPDGKQGYVLFIERMHETSIYHVAIEDTGEIELWQRTELKISEKQMIKFAHKAGNF